MKAVILAGGKGTRLRPLTSELPKPMVPIMNRPVMEHIILLLKANGITDICVTLMFLPSKIRDYFQDGSRFGVHLTYLTEDTPLGTAGCIRPAAELFDETFLIISGDCMTDFQFAPALAFHRKAGATATLLTTRVSVPLDYGVVIANAEGHVTGFLEKPSWREVISDTINTGIYLFEPEILSLIPEGMPSDFSRDIFPQLLKMPGKLCAFPCEGYWNDIGSLDSYIHTHSDIFSGRMHIQRPIGNDMPVRAGTGVPDGLAQICVGTGTVIDPTAVIKGPCCIGANCQIGPNAVIDEMCVIGSGSIIAEDVVLKRTILWNNCLVDFGSELQGVVVGSRVHLMHHVLAFENSIIGDESIIREHAFIKSNVKIWPRKIIEPNSIVDRNVVWANRHNTSLFGRNGMSGTLNVDITPEFAARLGSAYGTTLKQEEKVLVSSDETGAARLFKHAFISGVISAGIQVYTADALYLPVARQALPVMELAGGIHVMQDQDNPDRVIVNFLDRNGADVGRLAEKNIEALFYKEEFRRCHASDIPGIQEVHSFLNYYFGHLINLTQIDQLRAAMPKLQLFSTNRDFLSTVGGLLTKAGCSVSTLCLDRFSPYLLMQQSESSPVLLSAYIDANASELILMDRNGRLVAGDILFQLTSLILFRQMPDFTLLAPVNQSASLEEMARLHSGRVIRTKTDTAFILKSLIASDSHTLAWSQYALQFDPISSLMRITEYLTVNGLTLEELMLQLPPCNTASAIVDCKWETIGRVMRRFTASCSPEEVQLIDGMKFFVEGGWVLVVPDPDQPMIHIYAEHSERGRTQPLLKKYVDVVRNLVDAVD